MGAPVDHKLSVKLSTRTCVQLMCLWFDLLILQLGFSSRRAGRASNFLFSVHRFHKLHLELGRVRVQNLEIVSAKQEELGRSYF